LYLVILRFDDLRHYHWSSLGREYKDCFYFLSAVLSRGYAWSGGVRARLCRALVIALNRGVKTDKIGFDLSIITVVISAGLAMG